jgi:DNA-binding CsgD family transcriptional regulator
MRAGRRSHEDIAEALGISVNTVCYHFRRAKKVVGAATPAEAVERAREQGLV